MLDEQEIYALPLAQSETSVIEKLKAGSAGVPEQYVVEIERILQRDRALLTEIVEISPERLHLGQVALMGTIYRTHELLLGGLDQITSGHKHVWAGCLRGLVETFGGARVRYRRYGPTKEPGVRFWCRSKKTSRSCKAADSRSPQGR